MGLDAVGLCRGVDVHSIIVERCLKCKCRKDVSAAEIEVATG